MDGINIGRILSGVVNPDLYLKKIKPDGQGSGGTSFNSAFAQAGANNITSQTLALSNQLQMNQLANIDRSIYIKNLLGLPMTLSALFRLAQGNTPLSANTLLMNNLNEDLIKNQKALAQIFDETAESAITANQNQIAQNIQAAQQKDALALMFSGMIQMSSVSELILKNSKQAIAGLISAMASASKNGMTNEQIRDTLAIINSCVAMAESGNPAQTLKSVMLLYLPWLPLNEDVGFDLEVEADSGENESNNSRLTVLIKTKNFGNVKGIFTLLTSNSVDVLITCSEGFPKMTLQKSLMDEASSHAMNMKVDVEAVQPKQADDNEKREAKVNLSATNEMNPYLLLIAHAFIRNTIQIDSNGYIDDSAEGSTAEASDDNK